MAGLGLGTHGHLAAVSSDNAAQEALRLLAQTLSPPGTRLPTRVGLFAVPAQAYLTHDTLEQRLDVVVQRSRRLNELAVKDNGAGPALWCVWQGWGVGDRHTSVSKRWVGERPTPTLATPRQLSVWKARGVLGLPQEHNEPRLLYGGAQASLGHPAAELAHV